jgi:hypothetical protein
MKTAEEHIRNFWGEIRHDLTDSQGRYLSAYDIKLVIEQAQKEAYNEAFVEIAEFVENSDYNYLNKDLIEFAERLQSYLACKIKENKISINNQF